MISREQTSNLVKLAILVMINLCIIYFAFSQSPSSTVVSAENPQSALYLSMAPRVMK